MDRALSERVADAMFALSTPSRVQILGALLTGPKTVGELTDLLEMEQSAVSHQLRILREHELVRVERDGRRRVYDLQSEHLTVLMQAALDHVDRLDRGRSRLIPGRRTGEGA
jgi:DNA-binding transcriptional ArsR family regulator